MTEYLEELDWRVKENANMTYSLQGLNNHVASAISSHYWLNKIYPPEIREAHLDCDFHLHNLQLLAPYCCGWDLKDLLVRGFGGVPGKIESKPPKHFRTALGQLVNFLYTLQGEIAGAVAVANFDTYLAPFIAYDDLDYKQVKQAMQEFMFWMNVPTRVGFQTPFSNVTLDITPPGEVGEEAVIIGGQPQKEVYGDFRKEMDWFNRAFGEVMLEGDAKGRVFTFPIPTYNITKSFAWENEDLNPVWEMTAKYGIPYFANFINSDMRPEDIRSMCCRLRLDTSQLQKRGGSLFGSNPLTGSIGVVTINLPRIGKVARPEKEFLERLEHLMDLAKESLEIKRKAMEKFTGGGLYPYARHYLDMVKKRFGAYWANHFSTIGLLGMNEALENLMSENIASEKGRQFALEVLDFMREKLLEYQKETGHLYNLEATPAEGTTHTFAKADGKKYYTNSTQLPVDYTDDLFAALNLQDELQCKYTGGTVFHSFLGERLGSGQAVKNLVRRVFENYRLPYFTLTPTFSICMEHGYIGGEQKKCPQCGKECEIYSRVVGYLRPVNQWNVGKQAEFAERKEFVNPKG
jgi:ribonucleoside-triphosphate reductase